MSADAPKAGAGGGWASAWPDALAFAGGLALAWHFRWETRDLVWSLWLSSLVVGYAMIVWMLIRPVVVVGSRAWGVRDSLGGEGMGSVLLAGAAAGLGGLFLLAFFTVHFGGFHFVHSVFLKAFFPLEAGAERGTPGLAFYGEVFQRYWWFLPAAAIAERGAFRMEPEQDEGAPDTAVTVQAIAARQAKQAAKGGMTGMMAPYKNVIRLHLLIFFFAAASMLKLDSFLVYAVVYAAYFFPWRLVRKNAAG